ncbi:MAG: transcriptional regulator NrdR [Fibromonadales bacterium]|nr:transcriptional regulator NrdR [Fibromonadales bacterium]
MNCPRCKADNDKVIDTRANGDSVRRRRECLECSKRFTTYEYVERVSLTVAKRDGRREPFQREKLESGIKMACVKRPVSSEKIHEMVSMIENELSHLNQIEVSYTTIGDLVMNELAKLDPVAYVRFASVYKEFREVNDFTIFVRKDD